MYMVCKEKQIVCSVVIVNWNSTDLLVKCINSIPKKTKYRFEIIVVDNNSKHSEQNILKNIKGIILIQNNSNRGFAAANNQGFKIAKGEYIFMLNPDTVLVNNAIDKLIEFLSENNDIYAAGPKLFHSEKLDYHPSVKKFPTPFTQLLKMMPLSGQIKSIYSKLFFNPCKSQKVECVWGAAIMFKRIVFNKIGFLDERFFIYAEEVDYCKRLAINGMTLYYFPEAQIIHYGGKSQEKSSQKKIVLLWTSLTKYFEKYFSKQNIKNNYFFLSIILILKIKLFKKNDLLPLYYYIKEYMKCEKLS